MCCNVFVSRDLSYDCGVSLGVDVGHHHQGHRVQQQQQLLSSWQSVHRLLVQSELHTGPGQQLHSGFLWSLSLSLEQIEMTSSEIKLHYF